MTDSVRLRPAMAADASAISAIYNHYVLHSTATYRETVEDVAERLRWLSEHTAPHLAIVAEDAAGAVVGWGSLSRYHERSAFRYTAEDSVYLHHEHRGRGLGGRILTHLLSAAESGGLRVIVAVISADQEASLALHRRNGFTESGRLIGVGCKFGRWLDAVYMQRRVGTG